MNLERVFDSIMRIYPKSFRDRFGEELKLGFQDELNTNPSKLETANLIIDALTSATWERLQATKWLYWLFAFSAIVFYSFSLAGMAFSSEVTQQIEENLTPFFPYLLISTSFALLLRLERVPTRLEWFGMALSFFFPIDSGSAALTKSSKISE